MYKLILLPIFLLSSFSHAEDCETTIAYNKAAREIYSQVRIEVRQSYKECSESMHSAFAWKAIAECKKKGLGKGVSGGCAHLLNHGGYSMEKIDISHCDIFKVSKEDEKRYRQELLKKIDVQKCK